MERVGHDPLWLFREICVSEPLLDLASSFPHRPNVFNCARSVFARVQAEPAAIRWPSEEGVAAAAAGSSCSRTISWFGGGPPSTYTHPPAAPDVRVGSKCEELALSISCPLYPC